MTGRPDVDPAHKPGTGKRAEFCPGAHGGKNWPPIAFSPQTRMIYIPANNNLCGSHHGQRRSIHAGPALRRRRRQPADSIAPGADHFGEVQAWNVDTGQQVWTHNYPKSPELGLDAGDRRRSGVQRRHQRSQDPRVRRDNRQAAVGVPDQLGHRRAADVVHRSTASSTSPCIRAGAATRAACRRRSTACFPASTGSAGGRRRLGVRARSEPKAQSPKLKAQRAKEANDMLKLFRTILPAFVAGLAGAWLAIAAWPVTTDAQGYRPPRLADGHPDLNGIWQALNEANYDIQMHMARPAHGAA